MIVGEGARPSHSETARQIVHMTMGVFALLLAWLTWWQAIALAAAAVAFNVFALPRLAGRLASIRESRLRDGAR